MSQYCSDAWKRTAPYDLITVYYAIEGVGHGVAVGLPVQRCSQCRNVLPISKFSRKKYRLSKRDSTCLHCSDRRYKKHEGVKTTEQHGMANSSLYRSWRGMLNRCYATSDRKYHLYGGRGIRVCGEWYESFAEFAKWAFSNGYKEGLTVDREDVNGDYEPGNCRWATDGEQNENRRSGNLRRKCLYKGVRMSQSSIGKFVAKIGVDGVQVHIGMYNTQEQAAQAYDQIARPLFGEFASPNFPKSTIGPLSTDGIKRVLDKIEDTKRRLSKKSK